MSAVRPRISVIIPAFNVERYLPESIDSVRTQTLAPTEILVIDDGSTDGTAAVVRQFENEVALIVQENQGAGAARNRGVEQASGEFIAFLDADDLWSRNKLELQFKTLVRQSEAQMVFGRMEQFISPDIDDSLKETIACPEESIAGYSPCALFIRRETFLQIGFFETSWKLGEFIDWYAKAIEQGMSSIMLPDIVVKRRLHGANQTIRERDAQRDYVRILKASLDRRRKARGK